MAGLLGLQLTGTRLRIQRLALLALLTLTTLGLAGYFVSSPSEYNVTVERCDVESHPLYVGASVTLIVLVILAFATNKGRPTITWLSGIALVQLCTSGGAGCTAGIRDTVGNTCTYYQPISGLGGAFVMLAALIALPALIADVVLFVLEHRARRTGLLAKQE